jgi:hypothetical protein
MRTGPERLGRVPAELVRIEPAWATSSAAALSRSELREEIRAAMASRLQPKDAAVMVAIGLLGALPTGPVTNLPAPLAKAIGYGTNVRELLLTQLADGVAGGSLRAAVDYVGQSATDVAWVAPLLAQGIDAGVIPDLEDGFEVLGTAKLTNLWCDRRGWREGEMAYHQAKALAYTVNAGVGAYFNPDPLALGLAVWHAYKSLASSRALTAKLRALVDQSLAEVDATLARYHREVEITERERVIPPASKPFGELDDMSGLFDDEPRRSR